MKAEDAERLKELEKENGQLKRIVADKELENLALKEIAKETGEPGLEAHGGPDAQDRLQLSERRACEIAGQHRSTQRHQPKLASDDEALRRRPRKLSVRTPAGATVAPTATWSARASRATAKRIQRIWREEGLRVPARRRKRRRARVSTAAGSERLRAAGPGHVWALDFQHDASADGREVKFLNVVDEFIREALAVEVDGTIDADRTVEVLERLVAERGAPANLGADNGPELTASVLAEWCEAGSTDTAYIRSRLALAERVGGVAQCSLPRRGARRGGDRRPRGGEIPSGRSGERPTTTSIRTRRLA